MGSTWRSWSGTVAGQLVQVERAVRLRQDQDVVGPDAVRGAVGEEEGDLAGGEHGLPAVGQVECELELALGPAVRLRVEPVGAGVGRSELGGGDQGVEGGLGLGIGGVVDVENEGVHLPVRDDPDAPLAPEEPGLGAELPDRLELVPLRPLDDLVADQGRARAAAAPGVAVDAGAVLVEVLGGEAQLAGGDAGPLGVGLRDQATKTRSSSSRTAIGQSFGNRRPHAVLGGLEGDGRQAVRAGRPRASGARRQEARKRA